MIVSVAVESDSVVSLFNCHAGISVNWPFSFGVERIVLLLGTSVLLGTDGN